MSYLQTFQNKFQHIKYASPSNPGGTVASSGCGPVALLQVLENMTDIRVNMQPWINWVISTGARVNGGTSMGTLLRAFCKKYPHFSYATTSDERILSDHLRANGMAIGNVGGAYGSWKGLFSTSGHFITIFGVLADGRYIVGDPDWRSGKFTGTSSLARWRAERCSEVGKLIYVTGANLNSDTATRSPNYYLISYNREEEDMITQAEFDAMAQNWESRKNPTYKTLDDVPKIWRADVAELISMGAIQGDGKNPVAKKHDVLEGIVTSHRDLKIRNPIYSKLEEIPEWFLDEVQVLVDAGALKGDSEDDLELSLDTLRASLISARYTDSKGEDDAD